jgi:hypothetical protein
MAGNTINIDLNVQDQNKSMQSRTNDAKKLNEQLERANNLLRGTKTGSAAMRRAGFDPMTGAEVGEYNRARGAAGGGGASARDFADQARGLGGLVRLYATYAANIFAVAAAFNALREAMQTEVMIRSLDQLGAASGIAMGGLAKQFAEASGGAISLRESMEATAKAISSGMTRDQFMQLGEVAKGAAQALGLNMSDAVSRLTRGITKLEPELLDELGLFTKVGKAAEDYARRVGKTEAQLTDFERRQAFANAVLKEGRDKFGEIAQEGNPYDKLLSQLKNVAQDILTVVNNLVAPIAKLLADNTGLIAAAIGLAAIKITKTALPALGQWREGLKAAAEDAAEKATLINRSFQEAFIKRQESALGIPALEQNLQKAKQQLKAAQQELLGATGGMDKRVAGSKWFGKATSEDVGNEKSIAKLQETSAKFAQSESADKQKIAVAMDKVAAAQKLVLERSQALASVDDTLQEGLQKRARVLSELWQREEIRDQARSKAARLRILSEVTGDVEGKGFVGGIKELYGKAQADKDLGRIGKFVTVAQGGMIAAASAVGILGASLGRALLIAEVITAAFLVLDTLFSKNKKAVQDFDSAIQSLEESTKTATMVAEKYKNALTVDSINAFANSVENISDSLDRVNKAFAKSDQLSSWIDKTKDFLAVFWGGQRSKKLSENLVDSVTSAIQAMPIGEMRDSLQEQLGKVLDTTDLSEEGLTEKLKSLTTSLRDKELLELSRGVQTIIQNSKKALKDAQAVTQDVRETAKSTETAFQNLANATRDNSPLTVFLGNTIKQAAALKKALDDTVGARGAMDELTKKGGLEFLDPGTALTLAPLVEEYKNLTTQSDNYNKTLATSETRLKQLQKELASGPLFAGDEQQKRSELAQLPQIIEDAKSKLGGLNSRMEEISGTARRLIQDSVSKQIDASLANFKLRLQQLSVQQQQAIVGTYKEQTVEIAKRQTDLAIKAIDIQSKLSDSNIKLVLGIELLRLQVQRDADLRELQFYKDAQDRGNQLESAVEERQTELQKRISRTGEVEKAVAKLDVTKLSELAKQDPTLMAIVQQLQGAQLARTGFANQKQQELLKGAITQVDLSTRDIVESLQRQAESINRQINEITDQGPGGQGARFELTQRLRDLNQEIERERFKGGLKAAGLTLAEDIKGKTGDQLVEAQKSYDSLVKRLTNTYNENLAKIESDSRKALFELAAKGEEALQQLNLTEVNRFLDQVIATEERTQQLDKAGLTLLEQKLNFEKENFEFKNNSGQLSTEEYRLGNLRLQQIGNELALQKAILEATSTRNTATLQLLRDMAAAPGADSEFGPVPQAGQPSFISRGTAIGQGYQDATTAAINLSNQQSTILGLNVTLTDSATKLGDTWSQQFSKMTDAMLSFIQTGKFSFKDFMNSMLLDFTRTILQMQMQNFAKSLFGGSTAVGASLASFFGFSAMGNAFNNQGIMKYAKGGIFTNSIVNSPTVFKAAKGIGVMGEAGPEAIMPLKRDSNGNLGVRSNQGNVDIVVNNYSPEKATAKETTDARGNRRIEVTVGDMVAGELSRTNSSLQRTFTNTYGISSMVGRR